MIGVALFAATLLLSFTGYLLPWDQLAYWAVTVATNIAAAAPLGGALVRDILLGGRAVGQATLMRFYTLHIVVLPVVMAVLFAYHMWRIRKDGGLAGGADDDDDARVSSIPAIATRISVVTLATLLAVTVLPLLVPSPLEEPANPFLTPDPAKAPWYFLWLQEIVTDTTVRLGPVRINGALVGGVLLPSILLVVLTLWPWLDRSPAATTGVPFPRERRLQIAVFLAVAAAIALLTLVGLLRGPAWTFLWPWQPWPSVPTRF